MNEEYELEKLVIKNLEIVEQSRTLSLEIDEEFREKLKNLLQPQLVHLFPDCEYEFGLNTRWLYIDVKPYSWIFGNAYAQFSVDFHIWEPYDKILLYLSFCANIKNVDPGIFFNFNHEFKEKFYVDMGKEICYMDNRDKERLNTSGIILKNNRLYRPFQLNLATISSDWPNLSDNSIKPLVEALISVSQVKDIFDNLIKRITGQK